VLSRPECDSFDEPRLIPASIADEWYSSGLWSDATVSDVTAGPVDAAAIGYVVDGRNVTFAEMRCRSAALASCLAASGVRRGDRVVIQLANSVELLVGILACWRHGVIPVPVLPLFRAHELATVLRHTSPAAVIASGVTNESRSHTADFDRALQSADISTPARFVVGGSAPGWAPFPEQGTESSDDVGCAQGFASSLACALVLFTSGTTAEAKGVRHDSRSLLAEANSYLRGAAIGPDDVVFNPAPIAHIGALVVSAIVPWVTGCRLVLESRWDSARATELIRREKVTFAVGAPVFLNELVDAYEADGYDGHRVSKFQTGAAAVSASLLQRAHAVGVTAWRAWGMTEAPTISYGLTTDSLDVRSTTDGRVEPGSEVLVVDGDGRPQPAGVEGELLLRSPKQMMGYIGSAPAVVRDGGWLATGDLGRIDNKGYLTITGRVKDIVNRGGEKFSCREIEDALSSHPAINQVAVLGVPERRLGEQVIAYATVRRGRDAPGYRALLSHLFELGIARQKHPVSITFVDCLPVTATGKVRKAELARWWADTSAAESRGAK
jgi:acyl-CoA synthetase (AMP-forming)/AMP-acid ligase II